MVPAQIMDPKIRPAFLFTTDLQSSADSFNVFVWGRGRNDDEIEIGYYIMLSRL